MNKYLTNLSLEEICHYGVLGDVPVLSIEDWKCIQEKVHSFGDEQFESGYESCQEKYVRWYESGSDVEEG